ncbi:GerAB/ArcD/ProY family transporter [Peribacillus muralis]|uniref:GerAB/ArcD/ProY family transporter n=1 Tax=Peribacillus muralis TaxID=264697 RepID=UPI001F4E6396|nr:GerAB/ArcD/ProY family transporter [Peribacillus muralis]MCK1993467.1 spore germination protein [Peribacillus muralis]MCK2014245.1 spore germination protein [Peribacillus muralis]
MHYKQTVGIIEMMFAMMLFLQGSTIILGVSLEAGKDVWLAVLSAGSAGLILFSMYVYIWKKNDFQGLHVIFTKQLGKYLGFITSVVYSIYFAYIAARVITDFTQYINGTLLHNMLPFFIKFSIFLILIYTYLKGLEAFIRSAVIFGFFTLVFLLILPFIIVLSGIFNVEYIIPYDSIDVKQVAETVIPTLVTFPFGELIVFLALFPFIKERQSVFKGGSSVIIIFSIIYSILSFLIIGALHPDIASSYTYPFVAALEQLDTKYFIQRIDILAVIIFMIGGYFKITVFTFASIYVAKDCFSKTNINKAFLVSCIFIAIVLLSYTYSENHTMHIKVGLEIVPKYMHVPLQIIMPLIILLLTFVKTKRNKVR